jgi:hypothetical protein
MADGERLQMRVANPPPALAQGGELPPLRVTGGLFGVGYRVDAGSHWNSTGLQRDLQAAALTLDQLHEASLANLMKLVKGQPGLRIDDSRPCAGLLLDGDHGSSLVLLDGVWDAVLKDRTPNGAVVAIPLRDVLMFCDAAADGIAAMRAKRAELAGNPKLISRERLRRRDGRWTILPA